MHCDNARGGPQTNQYPCATLSVMATSGGVTGTWTDWRTCESFGRTWLISGGVVVQEANFRFLVGFLPFRLSRLCSSRVSMASSHCIFFGTSQTNHVSCRGIRIRREHCGRLPAPRFFLTCLQLLDVLNAHFQQVFGINKLQSTMLQLAYFVRIREFS